MTVLITRASKRFAIRRRVSLRTAETRPVDGLMVELSAEGGRISHLGDLMLSVGQAVTIATGEEELTARVRWSHDGIAGVRFEPALHACDLAHLLNRSRDGGEALRFGT